MEFDYAKLIYLLMLLSFLIWQLRGKNIFVFNKEKKLIQLLDKAEEVVSKCSGGYSGNFLSAEEFHKELSAAIQEYKRGDTKKLDLFYRWFVPSSTWDDFVGHKGEVLGDKIFDLITKVKKDVKKPA